MAFFQNETNILQFMVLCCVIYFGETVFVKSREPDTWKNAHKYCLSFGGKLATLENIGEFREDITRGQFILVPGEELWVGASLKHGNWRWQGEQELLFKDKHFVRRGCLHLDTNNNGTWIDALTPTTCLDHCGWRGQIGLKGNECFCDVDVMNISTDRPGVCHIRCGTSSNMCGGHTAISLYKPGERVLNWADGEPTDDQDCTVLRTGGKTTQPELVTNNCDMQTRYLCTFTDSEKCGFQNECARASTFYSTWDDAITKCADVNGTFAQLQEPITDEILGDLNRLPHGSFWVGLYRDRHWQWLDGSLVDETSLHAGGRFVHTQTCATVKLIGNTPLMTGQHCEQRLNFICQYDYMTKREGPEFIRNTSSTDKTPPYGLISDDISTGNDVTTDENPSETSSSTGGWVFTSLYMALGFMSGMVCVLILGLIVYLICRCRYPDEDNQHKRLDDRDGRQNEHTVVYTPKEETVHISAPITDITYDTVYDLETESPFRRTQRLIRMGSANSWRHAPSRRSTNPNATPSPRTGYTWRGVIGGGIEIINTELRHPISDQSDYREASTASLYDGASYNRTRAIIENRRGSSPNDFDQIDALYDLPERSDSFDYESKKVQRSREEDDPSFLELRTARNSASHEENIYATIKKTFQKIEEEIAEQARKDNAASEDTNK